MTGQDKPRIALGCAHDASTAWRAHHQPLLVLASSP